MSWIWKDGIFLYVCKDGAQGVGFSVGGGHRSWNDIRNRLEMRKNVLALMVSLTVLAMPKAMAQLNPLVQHLEVKEYVPYDTIDGPACFFELSMDYFLEGASDRFRASILKANFSFGKNRSLTSQSEVGFQELKPDVLPKEPVLNLGIVNKAVIENAFGKEYGRESMLLAAAHYRDAMVDDYRKNVKGLLEAVSDADNLEYSYYVKGEVIDTGKLFVTYRLEKSYYTGGAHPMHELTYLNFDGNGLISLEKLFGDRQDVLEKAVFKALLDKEGVKNAEGLKEKSYFPDQFKVSEDFYVNRDSIVFVYDPYEIAAYSNGIVEVAVPLKTLKKKGLWE